MLLLLFIFVVNIAAAAVVALAVTIDVVAVAVVVAAYFCLSLLTQLEAVFLFTKIIKRRFPGGSAPNVFALLTTQEQLKQDDGFSESLCQFHQPFRLVFRPN